MKAGRLLLIAYGLGTVGVLLQITAANWDVSWHILGIVETFFTPPHSVLYTGIAFTAVAALLGIYLRTKSDSPALTGLLLAAVGGGLQLVSGPLDFWWHAMYGFDPYLFTPTHSILITGLVFGGVGIALGTARLLDARIGQVYLEGFTAPRRLLQAMVIINLAVLWLVMNFFLNWLFNAQGIAYTFRICSPAVLAARSCAFVNSFYTTTFFAQIFLFAATGTLVLFASKKLLSWKGAAFLVGAIVIGIQAATELGFSAQLLLSGSAPGSFYIAGSAVEFGHALASGIPFYLALLIPIALFDYIATDSNSKSLLVAAVLLGPVSLYSEARFSFFAGLWSIEAGLIPLFVAPMLVGGLIAGLTRTKFADRLLHHVTAR